MHSQGRFLSRSSQQVIVYGPDDGEFAYARIGHTGEQRIYADQRRLADAVERLSGSIDQWITTSSDWEHRAEDERQPALAALRDAGLAVFEILEGGRPGVLRACLEGVKYLEVRVRRPHIPWEFLYLGEATGEVDLTRFLGYQLVVGRPADQQILPNNPAAPANDPGEIGAEQLVVGIAENERLDSALTGAERRIFTDRGVAIDRLPTIYKGTSLAPFAQFVEQSPYVIHFNCHAVGEDPRNGQTGALEVTETYMIAKSDIQGLPVCEESMVVLNCCHGHTLRHSVADTLATAFSKHHVSAVVASIERIVDDYSTLWAGRFYTELLGGMALGPALLAARRTVIDETRNPACLVYGFFGRYSARLTTALVPLAA